LAAILYDFLPGSGHKVWKGHVNFGTVANQVGVGDFWGGGSKKPAINALLSQTLQHRRHLFQNLMVEIVRSGIAYREKQNQPITRAKIERVNGHILDLGFKYPELWDREFLISLEKTTEERARDQFAEADSQQQERSEQQRRSLVLEELKDWFLQLACEVDRSKAGLTLEKLLNRLFDAFELQPN
jgi:hypothetical protein